MAEHFRVGASSAIRWAAQAETTGELQPTPQGAADVQRHSELTPLIVFVCFSGAGGGLVQAVRRRDARRGATARVWRGGVDLKWAAHERFSSRSENRACRDQRVGRPMGRFGVFPIIRRPRTSETSYAAAARLRRHSRRRPDKGRRSVGFAEPITSSVPAGQWSDPQRREPHKRWPDS